MKRNLLLLSLFIVSIFAIKAQKGTLTLIEVPTTPEYEFIDTRALNISSGGNYITGEVGPGRNSFVWSKENGLDEFDYPNGASSGYAVSDDGKVAGVFPDSLYMYWTKTEIQDENGEWIMIDVEVPTISAGLYNGEKWISLGLKDGFVGGPTAGSQANAISGDGTIIGGFRNAHNNEGNDMVTPTIWTVNGKDISVRELECEPLGQGGRIFDISNDGNIAGGWFAPIKQFTPAIWINGSMKRIDYKGVILHGIVNGISPNGRYAALSVDYYSAIYDIQNEKLTIINRPAEFTSSQAYSVSDNGIVIGIHKKEGGPWDKAISKAFIYNEKFGEMGLAEYLNELDIDIPEKFTFVETYGISGDGTKISGIGDKFIRYDSLWNEDVTKNVGFYIDINEHLSGFNPAKYLVAEEDSLGRIVLSWEAPTLDENNTLIGYNIYRNGQKIKENPFTELTYTDKDLADGVYEYFVKAVWNDNEEAISTSTAKVNTAKVSLPFFEDFSSSLNTQYWNTSSQRWHISEFAGVAPGCLAYSVPPGSPHHEYIISPYIDITNTDSLFLSYNIQIPWDEDLLSVKDTFKVEIFDGNLWHTVKSYSSHKEPEYNGFSPEKYNITSITKGKEMIRIRLTTSAEQGSFVGWAIDNINIYTSQQAFIEEKPFAISAYRGEDEKVYLNWSDPNGVVNLSYIEDKNAVYDFGIGNNGVRFMAANMFTPEDLKGFGGYKLTNVSGYLWRNPWEPDIPFAQYNLVIFKGKEKIYEQAINENDYTPNQWNTFILPEPITIEEGNDSIYFGFEIVTHDPKDLPIGIVLEYKDQPTGIIYNRKANLISYNNGKDWISMYDESSGQEGVFAITATLAKYEDAVPKGRILGYKLYRNGESLLGTTWDGFDILTGLNSHIDSTPLQEEACYEVSVYYTTQKESTKSDQACIEGTNYIKEEGKQLISIYPNPAKDIIYISGEYTQAKLIDLNGQVIWTTTQGNIHVNNIVEGIYFLEVITTEGRLTEKIIIRK